VRGLINLLLRIYSGRTPDEILDAQPAFIERIGMGRFLTSTRSNGLFAMIKQIKLYAAALKSLQEQDS
jgi:cysteine desulfuration protein SufE